MRRFNNKRFITKGVEENINPFLQIFMWQCIDELPLPQDYLQVFDLTIENGKQKISDAPLFVGKIFVIDDETHSTMLLAEEY